VASMARERKRWHGIEISTRRQSKRRPWRYFYRWPRTWTFSLVLDNLRRPFNGYAMTDLGFTLMVFIHYIAVPCTVPYIKWTCPRLQILETRDLREPFQNSTW
jgi:hypothetical protein